MVSISSHVVRLNSEQATSLIVERARQLVNQLIEHRGYDKPPFLSGEFARLLGYQVVKAELGETSAVLLKFHDGYVIKVNQNHSLARQNFSCAHEIGHVLFSELKLERYISNIEYRNYNPSATRKARATARERICEAVAAELIMPEGIFGKYLSGFGVSVHSIERLANVFRVSIQAAAIRIAEVSIEPCILLLWNLQKGAKSKSLRLVWRVGPGGKSRGKINYMPVHTLVKYPSTLHKAYEHDSAVKSSKLFKIDTVMKRCPMESKGFGRDKTRYVISLAFPDR